VIAARGTLRSDALSPAQARRGRRRSAQSSALDHREDTRTLLDGAVLHRDNSTEFTLRGPIVLQYDMPPDLTLSRIDRLSVHVGLGLRGGPSAALAPVNVRTSLYRWPDRTWVDVPISTNGQGDVTFGSQFIDGDAIRLRVEPIAPEVSIQQLDISLEGAR